MTEICAKKMGSGFGKKKKRRKSKKKRKTMSWIAGNKTFFPEN